MRELFGAMPKVELHLHLEGALPVDALWELVEAHGGDPEVRDIDDLVSRFEYRDFAHFIDTWVWKLRFHRTYEDYTFMAEAVARDLARQRIRYAEVFFSPTDVRHHGLEPASLAAAVRSGFARVPEIELALVPDLVRDTGPQRALRTLDALLEVRGEAGIVGITIGGSEQAFPPAPFEGVFRRAREFGLRTSAHAGEAAGPESVRDAMLLLEVDRIGHGVRVVEDPTLLQAVVQSGIPLEVCPTSNLRTGVARSWETHPVKRLIEAGATVTVNTDDPAMFGCDLAGEYAALVERCEVPLQRVLDLARNAIRASWAPTDLKSRLRDEFESWVSTAPTYD